MVGLLLGCDTRELLDDTTDALALALAAQTLYKSNYNLKPTT
jgi:Holliday junction resolvasome RuvABC endonuclease subunit